ncbi:MAG: polysaccharide deacetylase family protein [Erysipelotrichaceae bacterium]|nr:polysaccharide deacetylase family protein [Erysipelotrichaceae bacterium]
MAKRRRINKTSLYLILLLSVMTVFVFSLLFVNYSFIGKKSIHEDAKKYHTRHCLAFYPDSGQGLSYAKAMCKGVKDDSVYDYTLIPYGDYYLVNYGKDKKYFVDRNYDLLEIGEVSDEGKQIVLDYLRYSYKKDEPEKYYDVSFLETLQLENIDFESAVFRIAEENVEVELPQFEKTLEIPLKYMQKAIGMNLGFPNELYRKPVYLDPDPEHPVICLTFDDGPQLHYVQGESSTERIIDILYRYDACGTFYLIGVNLEDRELWADYQVYTLLKRSINQGNEYGSHSQTHSNPLPEFTDEEIRKEIMGPVNYLYDFMGYEMKTYRPVQGEFDDSVLEATDMPAILWDVDSDDWSLLEVQDIVDQVLKYDYETGDIILFHDIYDESADALEKILPELIKRGCQLVTVSDMLRYCDIDPSTIDYFFSPSYYE